MLYWIGLGSNLGDRLGHLRRAVDSLAALGQVQARSRVFAASPVGGPPQPSFLNAAVSLEASLEPQLLLEACHQIEAQLGRQRAREERWGPRSLDVDVLLLGDRGERVLHEPALEIPHPRLHERSFALAPLLDVGPALVHPLIGRPLSALLAAAQQLGHVVAPTGDTL